MDLVQALVATASVLAVLVCLLVWLLIRSAGRAADLVDHLSAARSACRRERKGRFDAEARARNVGGGNGSPTVIRALEPSAPR
jgi:hypothetical protein